MPEKSSHPNSGDLYTPITPEVLELLNEMRRVHSTWRDVSAISKTRLRVLRRIRTGGRKAISMTLLDRLITTTGVGVLESFTWFTADDLVALGVWDPPAEPIDPNSPKTRRERLALIRDEDQAKNPHGGRARVRKGK